MALIITLALIGLVLIYLEFYFPSGVSAVVAAGLLVASITLLALRKTGWGLMALYCVALAGAIVFVCLTALKHVRKKVALHHDQEGYASASLDLAFVGKMAEAATDLKPSGKIRCEGKLLPAASDSGYIPKSESVSIIAVRGSQYIVKRYIHGS